MKAKERFEAPEKKKYSVRGCLTSEKLQNALAGLRGIQTKLWESMDAQDYEQIEGIFDTATASMMAHLLHVDINEVGCRAGQEAGQDAAAPVLRSAT